MTTTKGNSFCIIGMMSGTSLDGLDIGLFEFSLNKGKWNFRIKSVKTYPYSKDWIERINFNPEIKALDLVQLDHDYGKYLAEECQKFIDEFNIQKNTINLIASHGHTLFHQPDKGFTQQIGNGPEITSICGIHSVCNFRVQDVALGGQGAPLVPIGDKLLFDEYEACLNLGGFANISFQKDGKRVAFDICPVNFVLNRLAAKRGKLYDDKGSIARKGNVNKNLLNALNHLHYYKQPIPKSLGAEWVKENVWSLLENSGLITEDIISSFTQHAADQIAIVLNNYKISTCLLSGGGTYNEYLLELIRTKSKCDLIIPSWEIINFKEALVFAFMGLLKSRNEVNILASVTGAKRDHSSGIFYNF